VSLYSGKAQARRGYRGGILGSIGGLIKRGAGLVSRGIGQIAPGPSGAVLRGVGKALTPPQIMKGLPVRNLPLLPGGGVQIQQDLGAVLTRGGMPRRIRKDGKPYKRPSMNFANGRAIRRAARRLEGAEKMFRRVFSIRHGHSAGKVLPKKKGR